MMRIFLVVGSALVLTACQQNVPAQDGTRRIALAEAPLDEALPVSPDTKGAVWALSGEGERLIYGKPGQPVLLAMACETDPALGQMVRFTRMAPAPAGAKAFFALVGNGMVARLKLDAHWTGRGWDWQGRVPVNATGLDVLTGTGTVEGTLPGAGSLTLNRSPLPRQLIASCRQLARPLAPQPALNPLPAR